MILVRNSGDPTAMFGAYVNELLRVEGFASTEVVELSDLSVRLNDDVDGILLPRMTLPAARAEDIATWVRRGGHLIALHPDNILLQRLGFKPGYHQLGNGIVAFRDHPTLAGLPLANIQAIVPIAAIEAGATGADLLADASAPDDPYVRRPAILKAHVDKGEVLIVAFDLARAVARLRHGDPALADMPNEIYDQIYRPSDLFRGQLPPQQAAVPQADILTAVLGRLVEELIPQPRLWYYPASSQRSVLVQTSDDDWSTLEQFETFTSVLKHYEGACTFYVVDQSVLTPQDMERWEADGHTFSVHPANHSDINHLPPYDESQRLWVPEMVRENVQRHMETYGRLVYTIRNHAIRWVGYVELARLFAELGIRGEANYFTLGPIPAGFLTGSGRPCRFVDADGDVIDVLQIPSHWTEEILVSDSHGFSERLLPSKARELTNGIMRDAAQTYHTPIVINSHPVSFATYSRPLIESNWKEATELGMPIWSADAWTEFAEERNGMTLAQRDGGFEVIAKRHVREATVLLPEEHFPLSRIEGTGITDQTIWGRRYHAVSVHDLGAGHRLRLTSSMHAS